MTQAFDKNYWESHWQQKNEHPAGEEIVPNPYLAREIIARAAWHGARCRLRRGSGSNLACQYGLAGHGSRHLHRRLSPGPPRARRRFALHPSACSGSRRT